MPVLSQCVPTLDLTLNLKSGKSKKDENVEGLKVIRDYMDTTSKLFKYELMGVPEFLKPLKAKEKEYISKIWSEFEYIPDEFRESFVPFVESGIDYSDKPLYKYQSTTHVEGTLSEYPITNLKNIISLADKLNMIIVSLDYVDLKNILKSLNLYDSYYESEYVTSIKYCRELLSKLGEKHSSELYILCPLSYYNLWSEIKSDKVVGKYYPDSLESIFTTIDLMIPAQRNLFKMSQVNNDNNKMLMKNLEENINVINQKLQKLENRVSNVEAQMEKIKEEQRKQVEEARQIKAELKRMEEMAIRYSSLDPLIFFIEGSSVDFFNKKEENRKAHLVTCFGPEFPAEFFTMNGITVYHKDDITIKYPSIYTSYAKKRYY